MTNATATSIPPEAAADARQDSDVIFRPDWDFPKWSANMPLIPLERDARGETISSIVFQTSSGRITAFIEQGELILGAWTSRAGELVVRARADNEIEVALAPWRKVAS